MTGKNMRMRGSLKDIEAIVTATLAQQPDDDEKCGRALYDALVRVYDVADMACRDARGEQDDTHIRRSDIMAGDCHCIGVLGTVGLALQKAQEAQR